MAGLDEIKNMPEANRLGKLALFSLLIWLLGLVLMSRASTVFCENKDRLKEADIVLNAAAVIKSYPAQPAASAADPMSEISSVIDSLNLKDRIGQISSGAGGTVLQVNGLYIEELEDLISALSRRGLSVKTAEIRAMPYGKGLRLINMTAVLEGVKR
jgi:hypothetical protein